MMLEEEGPHFSIAAGVIVGLVSSFVQSFGLTIQRLSHVANESLPIDKRKRDWQRPLWLGGFAIFIVSNVFGTLFQIGALPIVVLGPLGAVSLLSNAAWARFVLKDEFTVHLVVGTFLIAGGAVLIGIFGVVPEQTHTLEELVKLYRRPAFIIWVSLLALFLLLILFSAHVTEWRLINRIASYVPLSPTSPTSKQGGKRSRWMMSRGRRWSAPSRPSIDQSSPTSPPRKSALRNSNGSSSENTPLLADLDSSDSTRTDSHNNNNYKKSRPKPLRLTFAENESDADARRVFSPAPSIVTQRGNSSKEEEEMDGRRRFSDDTTRIWIGAAYGAVSGTLSGLCLLFTKTGIELLILTIMGKNQFGHIEAWLIVIVLLVCELFQLTYLNRALRLVGPTLVCPLAFCFYNTSSIVSGLIYYNQWDELSGLQIGLVSLGVAILLAGVWVVSLQSGNKGDSKQCEAEAAGRDGDERWTDGDYADEPDSDFDVDEDAEPLEWRPRGFSIGLAASSPGFELRPASAHRRPPSATLPTSATFPSFSHSDNQTSASPDQTAIDIAATEGTRTDSPRRQSCALNRSRRGLYVGHRRSMSGGSISLPTTPSNGLIRLPNDDGDDFEPPGERRLGENDDTSGSWWKFWNRRKRIELL